MAIFEVAAWLVARPVVRLPDGLGSSRRRQLEEAS